MRSFDPRTYTGTAWRLVEAQHQVSTLKLVSTLAEQAILEDLIEATKPAVPPECRHLDYLLSTPFRYSADYPKGSRFRRAGNSLGVFYASENMETAIAEMAFYRLLFFIESPSTPWPKGIAELTAFAVSLKTKAHIDLTVPPLVQDRRQWIDPLHYEPCQTLTEESRMAGIELIRYESVRDPLRRANLAVLTCHAFASSTPVDRTTWRMRLSPSGIQAICEFPLIRLEFNQQSFATDKRIATLNWSR